MQPIIIHVIDSFRLVVVIPLVVPPYPLIRSIFKAIPSSDIKSPIAFPTTSQTPHMSLAINGASTSVSPSHIIIHALSKSLSSLLSGSPIHVQPNSQSIYKPKINHSLINIIFILAGSVPIVPLSKEGIIHPSNCIPSPASVTMIAVLGGIFTMIYTLKIYRFPPR
jgi:NADH:ubiquinone oxidoreductase subunit 5 (subunit L)/multisubunit Na+/H+ antiporter MnhA subunit